MPDDELHDRLARGAARLAGGGDDEDDSTPVRIVPIPEGETTTGLSGEPTYWSRDVLKDAVENGAFDGAKLLKSPGGIGHKEMEALADPDNIVGSVDEWSYKEGVGPVGDGDLLDEHLSKLVDKGLVGVSPDLYRRLGEFDDDREAKPAEEIVDVPYITILDRGASDGATIEPASAEALAESPAGRYLNVRTRAENVYSDGDAESEHLAGLHTIRFAAWGEMFGDEFLNAAVSGLEGITGVSATRTQTNTDPTLLAVIDTAAVESLDELNQQIVGALADTPFEVHEDFDWLDRVADQFGPSTQSVDEGAESSTGQSSPTDTDMDDDPTTEELREQLAAAKAEIEQKDEQIEDLESETDELENEVETKEERIEALEEENEPMRKMLAERAANGSALSAEALADSDMSNETLAESIVDAEEIDTEDDDRSPVEIVSEQMAQSPTLRGGAEPEQNGPGGRSLDGDEEAKAERLANSVLSMNDVRKMSDSGQSAREYVRTQKGVDPAEHATEESLRAALDEGGDGE